MNCGILAAVQVRYLHTGYIPDGIVKVVVFIIQDCLAAVWNKLADNILVGNFFFTRSLFLVILRIRKRGIIISAEVKDRSEHTIIVQTEPGI